MRGLYKAHGAAQTEQARRDYNRLSALANLVDCSRFMTPVRANAGWRTLDAAARESIEKLLKAIPELRGAIREIYPGFVS